jgi:uncharacterized protein DUF4440
MTYLTRLPFVYAAALALCIRGVAAQSPVLAGDPVDSATRRELYAARDAVWRAWFASDTVALRQLLPPAVAAGSVGDWQDRETTIAAARQFAEAGGRLVALHFDSTRVELRGNVAVLRSRYHLLVDRGSKRTTQAGVATEVFVKSGPRWVNPFWYLE